MFSIVYRKTENGFQLAADVEPRSIPSDLVVSDDGTSFYVGCSVDASPEMLFNSGWERNPSILNDYCSALYIVSYDKDGCRLATDVSGRELLFYYFDGHKFILSDSFWGVVKEIEPAFCDLDRRVVAEMIASGGGVPCDNSTPVKNVFWAPVNMFGSFDAHSGAFNKRIYADAKRSCEVTSLDDAVESLDTCMTNMANYLVSRHDGERFGLGLSGGLDSRTALHYLAEAGIEPSSFNICVSRPHKILLASSVLNSRSLANAANANYCEVEWRPESIRSKMDAMLEHHPLGTCGHYTNAYKYETLGLPEFDVLITAGQAIGPNLVGGSVSKGAASLSMDAVFNYLTTLCLGDARPYAFTEGLLRGKLDSMGVHSYGLGDGPGYDIWHSIVDEELLDFIYGEVRKFMDSRYERGFTGPDIIMDYRNSVYGAIGRDGAYESLFGTKKSYTIYTPFLIKEGLRWDIPIVEDRLVLKELIKRKIPEFANVGEETYGGIGSGNSRFSSAVEKLMFLLRGSGIMADEWYARHKAIRSAFVEDMTSKGTWFYRLFPLTEEYEKVWAMSPSRMNCIWELKRLIDCIEFGRYREFN